MDRRTIGSWLSGPRAVAHDDGVDLGYPGQRLGLPPSGPGSIADLPRRLGAAMIDWLLCLSIAVGLLRGNGWGTLAAYAVENLLLLSTLGYTVGMRVLGLRVVRLTGGTPTPLAVAVRTLLLCLAVPALIWNRDGRGLHEIATATLVVRV